MRRINSGGVALPGVQAAERDGRPPARQVVRRASGNLGASPGARAAAAGEARAAARRELLGTRPAEEGSAGGAQSATRGGPSGQVLLRDMSPGMLRARLGPRGRGMLRETPGPAEANLARGGAGPAGGAGAPTPPSATRPPLSGGAPSARGAAGVAVPRSASGVHVLSVINLDTFLHNFSVPGLINRIANLEQQDLRSQIAAASRPQVSARQGGADAASLATMDKLLSTFERAAKELDILASSVDHKVVALKKRVQSQEEAFQVQVEDMEAALESTRASFQSLDAQMRNLSQAAAKIGDRLQSAEGFRKRALEGGRVIQHLLEFASAPSLQALPELFQDDARLAEAAAATRQILGLAQELSAAKERVGGAEEPKRTPRGGHPLGTVERAVSQIEAYRALLEHRVVARFDAAAAAGDLGGMAECARIMAEFRRGEAQLVQRYISTRAMFIDVRELAPGSPAGTAADAAGAQVALRNLGALFKGLLAACREDALVMEQVFPSARAAILLYVQRVFEQRVQAGVDRALAQPAPGAPKEALQLHLRLLAEAHKRVRGLVDQLQTLVGEGREVAEMAEGVFAEHLADYPGLELLWLQAMFEQRAQPAQAAPLLPSSGAALQAAAGLVGLLPAAIQNRFAQAGATLSPEAVAGFCACNAEAAERCEELSPAGALPGNVRSLFHSSTPQRASLGCLLEQVATHILAGLGAAVEACQRACSAPFGTASLGPPSRIAIAKAAYAAASEGVGRVLEAVGAASGIVRQLQQHYARCIAPRVEESAAEASASATGLAALVRAVEERVLAVLQASLAAFFGQAERTLAAEQRKADFRPPEDGPPPPLDRPTGACTLVAALLSALLRISATHLQGSNLAAFDAEVGRRAHAMLLAHMQRYVYSATGALRWKRDITEYADVLRTAHSPPIAALMEELASYVTTLLVAPESLLGLVDASLRLPHAQALTFLRLREDFKTARVGGQTLAQVFARD
ncbi:hypothetical protein WJX81_003494 [Elliptochloris bilobata]|uniref:Exocyst complex component Sec10 n=1 Tax=Elliptochloris bilobata TaxID=381761 RepID=A0AAW1RMF7_9CHLO